MIASSPDVARITKPSVFVSHSHKDEIYARKIVSWLQKVGFEPWASFEECSDKYRVEIDSALLACDIFLLIASKDAFASVEVRREINVAGSVPIGKPIAYYKLDNSSHVREGFLTLLTEKQFVQASRVNLELARLAEYLFEIWDGNDNEFIRQQREQLIQSSIASEDASLLKWRDKLWSLRLDANNNPRKLSLIDRDILKNEADRLGIIVSVDDENQAFSFNKSLFQRDLIGIVAKRRIDVSMVNQIEARRLECSVSKGLALTILNKRLEKIDYLDRLSMTKGAGKLDHWLVSGIKKAQGRRTGVSTKEKPRAKSYSFKTMIWPLEYYKNGACELKMDMISLSFATDSVVFHGLQGRKLFSLSIPTAVTDIAFAGNSILFNLDGYETRLVLRTDANSVDCKNLLKFISDTMEYSVKNLNVEKLFIEDSDIETSNNNVLSSGAKPGNDKQHDSGQSPELDQVGSDGPDSDEPDSFFYALVAIILLLLGVLAVTDIF